MNKSFFIGAVGAHQQMKSMHVASNNIANVNTYGFKAEKSRFQHLMYQGLRSAEEKDVDSGVGTRIVNNDTMQYAGGAASTNRFQDYMIEGNGFFALQDVKSGEISLTRFGAFTMAPVLEPDGTRNFYLTDGDGRLVLDQNLQPMQMENMNQKMDVGIFDCPRYNGMEHRDGTRFILQEKNGPLEKGTGEILNGALETSNVDLAQEMTNVIEAQRAYTMALKMVSTSDEIETTINNLR